MIMLACYVPRVLEAASPEQTTAKLRSLSMLPIQSVTISLTTAELQEPERQLSPAELERGILEWRKQLDATPADGRRYFKIGRGLHALKRDEEAQVAFSNAVPFFRAQADSRPNDASVQAEFAEALYRAGSRTEAEHVARNATVVLSNDWRCWAALGKLLDRRGVAALTDRPRRLAEWVQRRPSATELMEADECQAEANKCFDRAVALAPKEAEVYLERAVHRSVIASLRKTLAQFSRTEPVSTEMFDAMGTPEVCADWAQVARLSPTNYGAIAYWGWSEATPALVKRTSTRPIDSLTESRRRNVLEAMRLLENLAEHANTKLAAGALEALAVVRMMVVGEPAEGANAFRRAVALDPTRQRAWDGWLGSIWDNDPQETVLLCEQRLKHLDTANNRVGAAKACDRAGFHQKALEHARLAVKRDPKDASARICVSALLLRQPLDTTTHADLKQQVAAAHECLPLIEDDEHRERLMAIHNLNVAIAMALDGQTADARETLRNTAKMDVDDDRVTERLKEIELALGK
jgi:tetratricopeptide (TPR) repeat protein